MDSVPDVDTYLARTPQWLDEIARLRPILLECGLTEGIKWGKPCYTHDGHNVVIIQEMKGFVALMFLKGALLDDPEGVLVDQGPNSRSAKRIELTSAADVTRLAGTIAAYVGNAIEVEDSGIEIGSAPEQELVDELQHRLDRDPAHRSAVAGKGLRDR